MKGPCARATPMQALAPPDRSAAASHQLLLPPHARHRGGANEWQIAQSRRSQKERPLQGQPSIVTRSGGEHTCQTSVASKEPSARIKRPWTCRRRTNSTSVRGGPPGAEGRRRRAAELDRRRVMGAITATANCKHSLQRTIHQLRAESQALARPGHQGQARRVHENAALSESSRRCGSLACHNGACKWPTQSCGDRGGSRHMGSQAAPDRNIGQDLHRRVERATPEAT